MLDARWSRVRYRVSSIQHLASFPQHRVFSIKYRLAMTPEQAAKAIQAKADALKREIEWANKKNGFLLLQAARLHSEGPFSARELRRMGHPYATRHAAAPLDPAVINRQSGRF